MFYVIVCAAAVGHRQMGHRHLQDRRAQQQSTPHLRSVHGLPESRSAQIAGDTAEDLRYLHDDPRGSLCEG